MIHSRPRPPKNRQKKAGFRSSKHQQKTTNTDPSAPAKEVRAIQIQAAHSGSDSCSDESGGAGSDISSQDLPCSERRYDPKVEKESVNLDPRLPEAIKITTGRKAGGTAIAPEVVDPLQAYISIINIWDVVLILHQDQQMRVWLAGDDVPWLPGFISIGSRRYMEWQNQALEATTDARFRDVEIKIPHTPAVERPKYETPRAILQRPKMTLIQCRKVETNQDQDVPDCQPSDSSPSDKSPSKIRPLDLMESLYRMP
ncbi:LOW QUALITY PROTEIN: hypothetical protein PHMEG_00010090 [Phytophthora megakarya]|uniref:Uncharacterized protein n=1 Tax=Phytophthora megakarya TaxID=4795 RepID=A0A225WGA8_9STRA|nr:LOW QUALITY PROTEIN: hypothetical protein PHMEG_00010090 [Phytophthora megakarya]